MKKMILFLILIFVVKVEYTSAQWIQTKGPYGGLTRSLGISGSNLIVGTEGSGIFYSTDGGTNWKDMHDNLSGIPVYCIAAQDSFLFVGTYRQGVFRSNDDGRNWTAINSGLLDIQYSSIYSLTFAGKSLFATTSFGLFLSNDLGNNWVKIIPEYLSAVSFIQYGTTFLAGTDKGLLRSEDNGSSWSASDVGMEHMMVSSLAICKETLFAGTKSGSLYFSKDKGHTWSYFSTHYLGPIRSMVCSGDDIFIGCGEDYSAGTGGITHLSLSSDQYWNEVHQSLVGKTTFSLVYSSTRLIAATDCGVFVSDDNGYHWMESNEGIIGSYVDALGAMGPALFAGCSGGVLLLQDKESAWQQRGSELQVSYFVSNKNNLFACAKNGVFCSSDSGAQWKKFGPVEIQGFGHIAVSDTNIFMTKSRGGLFHSTDGGAHWKKLNTNFDDLSFFSAEGNYLFAGLSNKGITRSSDYGQTWDYLGLSPYTLRSIVILGNSLFAINETNGYFRSTDNGLTWKFLSPSEFLTVFSMASFADVLFVGTDAGVFFSEDDGIKWKAANDGLLSPFVNDLAIKGNDLFAATAGGGVWYRPLAEMMTKVEKNQSSNPDKFSLEQNYPNPFNSSTEINFSLPSKSYVSLKIYDRTGREVTVLASGEMPAGRHSKRWNPEKLPSGVYFCILASKKFSVSTMKITLIK